MQPRAMRPCSDPNPVHPYPHVGLGLIHTWPIQAILTMGWPMFDSPLTIDSFGVDVEVKAWCSI